MAEEQDKPTEDEHPEGGTGEQDKPETGKPADSGADDKGSGGEDWKGRSRQWEDRAKSNRKAADDALAERDQLSKVLDGLRKALDPDGKGEDDDPVKVAERAASERDSARAEARLARAEATALRAAAKAGADADALLDSRSFLDRIGKLDPADKDFAADVEQAVRDALKERPSLKAGKPAPGPRNAELGGGNGEKGQLTRADLKNMTPKQISEARAAGRLKGLLGG